MTDLGPWDPSAAGGGVTRLRDLTDVDAPTALVDGNRVTYDQTTNKFKGAAPAAGASGAGDPWHVNVDVFLPSDVGAWSAVPASAIGGGTVQSSGLVNDQIAWDLVLAAGTWDLTLIHKKGPDRGIYSAAIDGASVGSVDGYAASTASNIYSTITGIVVAAAGKKRLSLTMATQNAASSSFTGSLHTVGMRRTA